MHCPSLAHHAVASPNPLMKMASRSARRARRRRPGRSRATSRSTSRSRRTPPCTRRCSGTYVLRALEKAPAACVCAHISRGAELRFDLIDGSDEKWASPSPRLSSPTTFRTLTPLQLRGLQHRRAGRDGLGGEGRRRHLGARLRLQGPSVHLCCGYGRRHWRLAKVSVWYLTTRATRAPIHIRRSRSWAAPPRRPRSGRSARAGPTSWWPRPRTASTRA